MVMQYYSWQSSGLEPGAPYTYTSPNIAALRKYVLANFGGTNLGTYGVRPITGGTSWSTHAFGAAWDWGFYVNGKADRAMALKVIDWLIEHHEVLGVQMIVDEGYDRAWKCSRPNGEALWRTSDIAGGYWLHIESHPDHWFNDTPIGERLALPPVQPPPPVVAPPTEEIDMIVIDYMPGTSSWTALVWTGVDLAWIKSGHASAVLSRANVKRITITDPAEMLGIIEASRCTTVVPHTFNDALSAAWN